MSSTEYDFHYNLIENLITEYREVAEKLKDKTIDFKKINEFYIKWVKELDN